MSLPKTLVTVALAMTFAMLAGAQAPVAPQPDFTVHVRVLDTAHAPVGGADVSIVRGLQELVARATSDDGGRATLSIPRSDGDLQLNIRKIGYGPSDQFFAIPRGASTTLEIVLHRAVQTLAPVTVTAAEDAKQKSYHVDADAIATSTRPIFDAMDVVTKLLPDVIYGRAGKDMGCGVKDVWVNGTRVIDPPSNAMVSSRVGTAPPVPVPQLAMKSSGSGRRGPMSPLASVDSSVWLALATIKPEHIAEVTYEDCFSTKVENKTHANQALFIVLKPGVGYDPGRGSYVVDNEDSIIRGVSKQAVAAAPTPIPAYRARLLGVYDATTGDPVEHAIVADSSTGTSAATTVTGTVSLLFLPEGPSTLRISKPGFAALRVDVTISPRDTVPITLILGKPH